MAIFAIKYPQVNNSHYIQIIYFRASKRSQSSPIAEIKFPGCALGTSATGANERAALALASLEFLQQCNTTLEFRTLRRPNVLLEETARHGAKALGFASGPAVAANFAE